MKTRQELIDLIRESGSDKREINGINFKIFKDSDGEAVSAKIGGGEFKLWSHCDEVTDFYGDIRMRNLGNSIFQLRSLAVALDIELSEEHGKVVENIVYKQDTEKFSELNEKIANLEGMIGVYEKIFNDRNNISLNK